ncbi:MAG: DUF3396 domain-containing protein [Proteobacteria bacterium]|nr:DUF3396 domain-containing protein [Pseudomonadota bacterium]
MTESIHDALYEFDDDPIGSMRKAAAHFEQNPVMYTYPISKKTKAIARIGLRAVFFLPAREREIRLRMLQAMEAVREAFGDKLRWIVLEGGKVKAYQAIPLAVESLLDRYKGDFGVYVGSSDPENAEGLQDFQANFFCQQYFGPNVPVMDAFEFHVPLSWSIDHAAHGGFTGLAGKVANLLRPDWGTAGFALTVIMGHMNAEPSTALYPLSQQYPGLDCGEAIGDTNEYPDGMGAVNWLTWVSDKLLQRIGGREAARTTLRGQPGSNQVKVAELDWGLLFQAGVLPGLGDNGDPGTLPAYQALARALKPLRAPNARGFTASPAALNADDEDEVWDRETRAWVARFD